MMNGLIRKKIADSGLKKKFIASALNIAQSDLSQYLKGNKVLPLETEKKLNKILTRQEITNASLSKVA